MSRESTLPRDLPGKFPLHFERCLNQPPRFSRTSPTSETSSLAVLAIKTSHSWKGSEVLIFYGWLNQPI